MHVVGFWAVLAKQHHQQMRHNLHDHERMGGEEAVCLSAKEPANLYR